MTGHAGFWKIEYKDQQDPKLYADDDMDTCTSIAKMLRQMGVRSEWTVSGKEAIIRAKLAKRSVMTFMPISLTGLCQI